jgi:hypothetical protein
MTLSVTTKADAVITDFKKEVSFMSLGTVDDYITSAVSVIADQ